MSTSISHTRLYSYLVTRPTGREVRTNIERQLETFDDTVLAVLDLEHVELIDFSCADEVVAKLVTAPDAPASARRFFFFTGIADRHSEPIDSTLARQGLVAVAETVDGDPVVMGELDPQCEAAWRALWRVGRAGPGSLADDLAVSPSAAAALLDELEARSLVIRDGDDYLSFARALADAVPAEGRPDTDG